MTKIFVALAIFIFPLLAYSGLTSQAPEGALLSDPARKLPLEQTIEETRNPGPAAVTFDVTVETYPVFNPALPISDAVSIAERFVREREVDVSGQYVHSVQLNYDDGTRRKGHYWRVQWMWSMPKSGGEYSVRVYMDGTVLQDSSGS